MKPYTIGDIFAFLFSKTNTRETAILVSQTYITINLEASSSKVTKMQCSYVIHLKVQVEFRFSMTIARITYAASEMKMDSVDAWRPWMECC